MNQSVYQTCIDACLQTVQVCQMCADSCQHEQNPDGLRRCIVLDKDCAEFCKLTVDFIQRNSEFSAVVCENCAEICRVCSEECNKHSMEHCQVCAKTCHFCMEECLRVLSH